MAPRDNEDVDDTSTQDHIVEIERGITLQNDATTRNRKIAPFNSDNESYHSSVESNVTSNNIIIKNRHGVNPWFAGKILMISLTALEIFAQLTDNPNFAVSAYLLTIHFWSAVAPFGAIALRLAPIPTIMKIRQTGTNGLPFLPYSSMFTLTFTYAMYGFTKGDQKIIITNGIGMVITLYYCVQYLRHCPENAKNLPGTARVHKLVSLCIILFILSVTIIFGKKRASWVIGRMLMVLGCTMYISPLSQISTVIKNKSATNIPLPFAVAGLFNTFAWAIYGLFVKHDFVIWVPCLVGIVSTSAQIFLKALWGRENPVEAKL